MAPRGRRYKRPSDIETLLSLMDDWPQSWAGDDKDVPIGRHLTTLLRPFIKHVQQEGLSTKTLRRHLDNLWLIGGEIIRGLYDDRTFRAMPPRELLLDAIVGDEAPLVHGLSESEQKTLDATARKLRRFLLAQNDEPSRDAKGQAAR